MNVGASDCDENLNIVKYPPMTEYFESRDITKNIISISTTSTTTGITATTMNQCRRDLAFMTRTGFANTLPDMTVDGKSCYIKHSP